MPAGGEHGWQGRHVMANPCNVLLQRTLHPVGQGGFYTEQFFVEDTKFPDSKLYTVVYDCGSMPVANVENAIDLTFHKGYLIDALFISHFDNDHINGLRKLRQRGIKLRYLVLPLLTNTQKILAFLSTGICKFGANEIKTYLGVDAEKVIYIRPVSSIDNENRSNDGNPVSLDGLGRNSCSEIFLSSGTKLKIADSIEWAYIPFNICDDSLYEKILEALKTGSNSGLCKTLEAIADDSTEIETIEQMFTPEEQARLKEIYNSVTSRHKNDSSVVVYSGPLESSSRLMPSSQEYGRWALRRFVHYGIGRKNVAIVYTGDINLNKWVAGSSFKKTTVVDFLSGVLQNFIELIGTIQVPHHGSCHNFNSAIIGGFPNARSYFYSYGNYNTYHHPFPGIRMRLLSQKKQPLEITEDFETEFTQLIKII